MCKQILDGGFLMISRVFSFVNQVKQEFFRITWSGRKQAMSITLMVFVMVFITALYFFVLDWILSKLVGFFLNLG